MAITVSPERIAVARIRATSLKLFAAFNSARSLNSSVETTLRATSLSPVRLPWMSPTQPSMTWLLVTMWPPELMTKPVPLLLTSLLAEASSGICCATAPCCRTVAEKSPAAATPAAFVFVTQLLIVGISWSARVSWNWIVWPLISATISCDFRKLWRTVLGRMATSVVGVTAIANSRPCARPSNVNATGSGFSAIFQEALLKLRNHPPSACCETAKMVPSGNRPKAVQCENAPVCSLVKAPPFQSPTCILPNGPLAKALGATMPANKNAPKSQTNRIMTISRITRPAAQKLPVTRRFSRDASLAVRSTPRRAALGQPLRARQRGDRLIGANLPSTSRRARSRLDYSGRPFENAPIASSS